MSELLRRIETATEDSRLREINLAGQNRWYYRLLEVQRRERLDALRQRVVTAEQAERRMKEGFDYAIF